MQRVLEFHAEQGGDVGAVCRASGLPEPSNITSDALIPADRYYDLMNKIAECSGDRYFAAHAGVYHARSGLPALAQARISARTLGEFLMRVQIIYRQVVSNAHYDLQADGKTARFSIVRAQRGAISPDQVDVMNAVAFVTLILDELGRSSLPKLIVAVPDPNAIPKDVLPREHVVRSTNTPMSISFPAEWLVEPLRGAWSLSGANFDVLADEMNRPASLELVRSTIARQLRSGQVSLDHTSDSLGISKRQLQRYLSARQTTFRLMLNEERVVFAKLLLETSQNTTEEIAHACGYSSAAALARTTKRLLGQSPSSLRGSERPAVE